MKKLLTAAIVISMLAMPSIARDDVNLDVMNKIRDEGFNRSQIMKTLKHLSDNIGPRLSGSPALKEANDWTKDKFTAWGLKNAHLEGFEFGRGWTYEYCNVVMTAPRVQQIYALPVSWHPGTNGSVEGSVMKVSIKTEADFEKYKGKLKGKILAISGKVNIAPLTTKTGETLFIRHDEESLADTAVFDMPSKGGNRNFSFFIKMMERRAKFGKKMWAFLKEEGALATIKGSRKSGGQMDASGYSHQLGSTPLLAQVSMAAESYNRMLRMLGAGKDVKIKMEVRATFYDEDTKTYNTIADIPGKDRKPEIVMAGAHIDSWHLGDGTVDNGAGVVVVMEAMRILTAIGIKPKRTIRAALWGGEEQGLYGSRSYVKKHFLENPKSGGERIIKPEHSLLSVYFNLDNGSGKIRGIYTQGNVAAAPIFKEWLIPFHDVGATAVTLNSAGGTDHLAFQSAGLPGYQFIQDSLDYSSRLHHSQLDVFNNAHEDDLKQASVLMAAFIYNAAMREDRMPRKPMPKQSK